MTNPRGMMQKYKLRLRRKRLLWRAFTKRRELSCVSRKTGSIKGNDILLFACLRNEILRLPYFLDHYRRLGVQHFLFVDNGSEDGTSAYLAQHSDVSLWRTATSYKASRFGMDWLTSLLWKYGHGHWTLTVDADELFIYPEWQKKLLPELTQWLDSRKMRMMGALMLDLYPQGPVTSVRYRSGQDPTEVIPWFDAFGYWIQRQQKMGNLWVQGGPRARHFFADHPDRAPTLNKIPLVRWDRSYVFVNSTHNALPAHLNETYDTADTRRTTGVLLHTKFLQDAAERALIEQSRAEHFADPTRYLGYFQRLAEGPDLWTPNSYRYADAAQLEELGLMFRGSWPSD